MKLNLNNTPFYHVSRGGTEFTATRCDLEEGIVIEFPNSDSATYASDIAEMIGYHSTMILPELNGFQGYDCIIFKIKK